MPTDKTDRNGDLHDGSTGRYKSKGESNDSFEGVLHTSRRKKYTEINPQMILDYSKVTKQEWAKWYTAIGEIQRGMWCPKITGNHAIQIGNKIFLTRGTYSSPILNRILCFETEEEVDYYLKQRCKKW